MFRQRSSRVLMGALCLVVALGACRFTGFGNSSIQTTASRATTWLRSQQQNDGGFEVSGFPGFETPDATLAIANQAQPSYVWNATTARNAVLATVHNGHTPLHALDDYAAAGLDAGQAAKLIILVTVPLGLSSTAFDPDGDGAQNLVATVDAGLQPNGSYGVFNATLYAAIAKKALGGAVPASTLANIRAAQKPDGSWSFTGSPVPSDPDIDTTATAIQALVAAGVAPTDPDLVQALQYFVLSQQATGSWQAFGAGDPNSTSTAILAITAAGFDVSKPCWRDTVAPIFRGHAYADPLTWLRSQQAADGHVKSPNDSFGTNTFATSQSVQALERYWLPVAPLAPRTC